jgi:hypothetical protein
VGKSFRKGLHEILERRLCRNQPINRLGREKVPTLNLDCGQVKSGRVAWPLQIKF